MFAYVPKEKERHVRTEIEEGRQGIEDKVDGVGQDQDILSNKRLGKEENTSN